MTADDLKKAAAAAAVELVRDGQKLGLGTGSTANHFIDLLAQRVKQGLKVEVVPTSKQSHERAKRAGIPLTTLEAHPYLDLTVDGTDEFDGGFNLIKGGGGALLLEKIVASSSRATYWKVVPRSIDHGRCSPILMIANRSTPMPATSPPSDRE